MAPSLFCEKKFLRTFAIAVFKSIIWSPLFTTFLYIIRKFQMVNTDCISFISFYAVEILFKTRIAGLRINKSNLPIDIFCDKNVTRVAALSLNTNNSSRFLSPHFPSAEQLFVRFQLRFSLFRCRSEQGKQNLLCAIYFYKFYLFL